MEKQEKIILRILIDIYQLYKNNLQKINLIFSHTYFSLWELPTRPPPLPSVFPSIVIFFSITFPLVVWSLDPRRARRRRRNFWVRPGFMGKWNFGKLEFWGKLFFWPRVSESGNFENSSGYFGCNWFLDVLIFTKIHCFVFCVTKSVIFSRNCLFIIFD